MYLEIITPEKEVFKGSVHSATFPGSDGAFQVLTDHAPLISSLAKGELSYVQDKSEASMMVEGGVVEVLNNTITVLAEKVIQE
ncbi:ATP synthase F1 subunit epsilon [Marivirga atlantica]|jgi:F-type H+-transporting ATPase subunit epsilon|uniref:ATP synthase F1 subunit epsilon n=1 Tax=Marivirga atlantica TaxID=1548457 RepID=A0A937AJ44_9BACT|nr:ATP synthase F1 subunit epsilon [Marivirga atlantica]MBL0763662.1 ATP synthase F1 subunit epsilon [Marivirga atlantica]